MSEDIFRPSPSRRVVIGSGLPLSHYFRTSRELKQFIEDGDRFLDECFATRDGNQEQESKPEEPSRDNRQKYTRRIRRRRAEKHT